MEEPPNPKTARAAFLSQPSRKTVTRTAFPQRCFISYAYADAEACDRLLASLPRHVEPVVFPPITVAPDELVSNELIESLLACDALIYVRGDHSDRSFRVAFERDYALRAGKEVFTGSIDGFTLEPHLSQPLDLATFAIYHRQDEAQIRGIAAFLKSQRHFDLWLDVEDLQAGTNWEETIRSALEDRLSRGGLTIVFWSHAAAASEFMRAEIQRAAEGIANFNNRVLFALLEDVPIPDFWFRFQEPTVRLYGDEERSALHRQDDLVVRLYWLIFRNTEQRLLETRDA